MPLTALAIMQALELAGTQTAEAIFISEWYRWCRRYGRPIARLRFLLVLPMGLEIVLSEF